MAPKRLSREQTEQLIELVRQKPYIYDVTDPGHADATKIANAWLEITEKMGLKEEGYSLKDKWKNIRDHYIKKRREQKGKSGDGAKPKVIWPYYEMLSFLNDYATENNETDSNVVDPDEEEQDSFVYDLDSLSHIISSMITVMLDVAQTFRVRQVWSVLQQNCDHSRGTTSLQSTQESRAASDDDTVGPQSQHDEMPARQRQVKAMYKPHLKRRMSAADPLDEEIKERIRQRKHESEEIIGMSKIGANELFFQSCAIRTNKLSPAMQSDFLPSRIVSQCISAASSARNSRRPSRPWLPIFDFLVYDFRIFSLINNQNWSPKIILST